MEYLTNKYKFFPTLKKLFRKEIMDTKSFVDQLNAFADAESIKEFLKTMGVTGFRQDEMSCPISNWVSGMTGHPVVTEDVITVFTGHDWNYDAEEFTISKAVQDFIAKFDTGHYPELDADSHNYRD